jgi:hypothetical protein
MKSVTERYIQRKRKFKSDSSILTCLIRETRGEISSSIGLTIYNKNSNVFTLLFKRTKTIHDMLNIYSTAKICPANDRNCATPSLSLDPGENGRAGVEDPS